MATKKGTLEAQGLPVLLARVGPYVVAVEAYWVRVVDGQGTPGVPRLDLRASWGCPQDGPGKVIGMTRQGEPIDLVVDDVLEVAVMPLAAIRPLPPPLDRVMDERAAAGLGLVEGLAARAATPFAVLLDVFRLARPESPKEQS